MEGGKKAMEVAGESGNCHRDEAGVGVAVTRSEDIPQIELDQRIGIALRDEVSIEGVRFHVRNDVRR